MKKILIFVIGLLLGGVIVWQIGPYFREQDQKSVQLPPEKQETSEVIVSTPQPNELIGDNVEIKGEAKGSWFFEGSLPIKIVDEKGNEVSSGVATASENWMTEDFVPFTASMTISKTTAQNGSIIIKKDNPSGLPENDDSVIIPIHFAQDVSAVKVFFGSTKEDPEVLDCEKSYPTERQIPKTQEIARAAIEELLKGPTEEEKSNGFFTSINDGVKIQKLTIENKIAYIDFDKKLEEAVGGSCKTSTIISQITETLKQFPSIEKVVISIDGRTEDILQP